MAKILLITDSRGLNFEPILKKAMLKLSPVISIKVLAVRGANLKTIEDQAVRELAVNDYDQTYIILGINNLTKFWGHKQVILAFDNMPMLVDTMDDLYTDLKLKLQKYSPRIIVCHLLGMDILTYNLSKISWGPLIIADYPSMQEIINTSITCINRSIDSMNISSNVIGPWLEDTIHTSIKGKKVNKYLRLYDGLHPDATTKKLWAKKLAKAFLDNMI